MKELEEELEKLLKSIVEHIKVIEKLLSPNLKNTQNLMVRIELILTLLYTKNIISLEERNSLLTDEIIEERIKQYDKEIKKLNKKKGK